MSQFRTFARCLDCIQDLTPPPGILDHMADFLPRRTIILEIGASPNLSISSLPDNNGEIASVGGLAAGGYDHEDFFLRCRFGGGHRINWERLIRASAKCCQSVYIKRRIDDYGLLSEALVFHRYAGGA